MCRRVSPPSRRFFDPTNTEDHGGDSPDKLFHLLFRVTQSHQHIGRRPKYRGLAGAGLSDESHTAANLLSNRRRYYTTKSVRPAHSAVCIGSALLTLRSKLEPKWPWVGGISDWYWHSLRWGLRSGPTMWRQNHQIRHAIAEIEVEMAAGRHAIAARRLTELLVWAPGCDQAAYLLGVCEQTRRA